MLFNLSIRVIAYMVRKTDKILLCDHGLKRSTLFICTATLCVCVCVCVCGKEPGVVLKLGPAGRNIALLLYVVCTLTM